MASVKDFLKTRELQGSKAAGGGYVRLLEGEYLVQVEAAKFDTTRKKMSSLSVGAKIITSTNDHPSMAPGRKVDVYVGDSGSEMYLQNVRAVVDALFGIYGTKPDAITAMDEEDFTKQLDFLFMAEQGAAGEYLFARAVDSGKPNPKRPGENYINVRWATPRAADIIAGGIEVNPEWLGVV